MKCLKNLIKIKYRSTKTDHKLDYVWIVVRATPTYVFKSTAFDTFAMKEYLT